jgi:hypothetical protein
MIDTPTSFGFGVRILRTSRTYVVGGAHGRSSLVLLFHCRNGADRTGHVEWTPPKHDDMQAVAFVPEMSHFVVLRGRIFVDQLLGAKRENGRSQVRDSVDIFSVLALRVSTWVTYSPQDSVQRLLLCGNDLFKITSLSLPLDHY